MVSFVIYAGYERSDIAEQTHIVMNIFFCNDYQLHNPHDHMHRKNPVLCLNLHFSFNVLKKIMICSYKVNVHVTKLLLVYITMHLNLPILISSISYGS